MNWGFLRTLLLTWLFLAVALARLGLLGSALPVVQIILIATTVGFGLAAFFWPPLHDALRNCDIRWLVLFHVSRFVGIWFLVLYEKGRLPYDFAVKGGWGDIIIASLAIAVLLIPENAGFRVLSIRIWNVLGLLDILFVVATAVRLTLADRHSMDELRHIPLSLLPTFLVPLIIVTHLVIEARVRAVGLSSR
ncbi:MAG: hypothetical protein EBY17_04985 [Acidobacteriia bacterium]|nr:hypothetical protein [Terriglobia bacterium]